METFPVFQAAQRGLIDQDTCRVLLEAQLILGGLVQPSVPLSLTLEQGLEQELIDTDTRRTLAELEAALLLVEDSTPVGDQEQMVLPAAMCMELGLLREEVGLRILELQINTGGLRDSVGRIVSLEEAEDMRLLTPRVVAKLLSRLQHRELIDPNTAEKLNFCELQQRCVLHQDSGVLLFPVKQQPGGTVCLRSGRKVGIFRAVQEGLIDRKVTVRLLEAQLLAGGIADPRSGHRLTVEEAVRHGLMDQDLACAMLMRQLQNGGIVDPISGERLDLDDSIRRDLLSSRSALLVLQSVWNFMGLLWPESGELLPMPEALQQGLISGELARSILRRRHSVGALYNPDTLQVVPLSTAAGEGLDPRGVHLLKDIFIPDVLPNTNQTDAPSFNRCSWGSTSSSPPPSSPLCSHPTHVVLQDIAADGLEPEEQARHKLLFHLATHSYVDAHSGKRLVLLNPELRDLMSAVELVAVDTVNGNEMECLRSLSTVKQLEVTEPGLTDEEVRHGAGSLEEKGYEETDKNLLQNRSVFVDKSTDEFDVDEDSNVKSKHKEIFTPNMASAEEPGELATTDSTAIDKGNQEIGTEDRKTTTAEVEGDILKEPINLVEETNEDVHLTKSEDMDDIKCLQTELETTKQKVPVTEEILMDDKPLSAAEKGADDVDLSSLVLELKEGGLMTEDGQRLLPDEAVAQGVLLGHTAVQIMAQAGVFGGFLDASSGESLSISDVIQKGLLAEDLMWTVLKSDKTLSGVVDVDKKQIRGVREAAQAGLIDCNIAARLLEAQVASGGIVDLRSDKKVSVALAANLGLIEEDQQEELVALEKAYKGKVTDSATSLKKAHLQLQMDGVIDPELKSPVPLEKAIQQGLIRSEEAYQVLAKQVAEGGIIHHASGLRLSVADAVDRGLVDRSIAVGLEELEWVYQGKLSPSSHPEATMLQASTGLLDKNVASEATASPALDPQPDLIVPYSELVRQGKIDIDTGKRFLEVKPFRENEQTHILTVPEGVKSMRVDPVPADSEGVIDTLPDTCKRGLAGDDIVTTITSSQIYKGGLADVVIGQHVSSPTDATAGELTSRVLASERVAPVKVRPSSNGSYSHASSQGSPANESDVNTEQVSPNGLRVTEVSKTLTDSGTSTQSQVYDTTTEDDKASQSEREAQQSMDVLCSFTTKLEKRIQQAIDEITPQKHTSASEKLPQPEACENEDERNQSILRQSMVQVSDMDKVLQKQKGKVEDTTRTPGEAPVTVPKEQFKPSDEVTSVADHVPEGEDQTLSKVSHTGDERHGRDRYECPELIEEEEREKQVAAQRDDGLDVKDIKSSPDQSDQALPSQSKETESKTKKKRKNKKKLKVKEAEDELQPPPTQHACETANVITQDKPETSQRFGQTPTPSADQEAKVEAESDLADQDILKVTGQSFEPEKVARKMTAVKEKNEKESETNKEEPSEKVKEKVSVRWQPEQPENNLEVKTMRSTLRDDEKTALILKAKERILKKVFEKGVSEKQAAEELQALRREAVKWESPDTGRDVTDGTGSPEPTEKETKLTNISVEKVSAQVEDKVHAPSPQPKETQQSKRSKKTKKSKSSKATHTLQTEMTTANIHTRVAVSELIPASVSGKAKDLETHQMNPEEPGQERAQPAGDTGTESGSAGKSIQPEAQSSAADTLCDAEKGNKEEGPRQRPESPASQAFLSAAESDPATGSWGKEEDDIDESLDKEEPASVAAKVRTCVNMYSCVSPLWLHALVSVCSFCSAVNAWSRTSGSWPSSLPSDTSRFVSSSSSDSLSAAGLWPWMTLSHGQR